jgi:hypothetical protein
MASHDGERGPRAAHRRGAAGIGYALLLASLGLADAVLDARWLFDGPGRDTWIYYGYFRFARIYLHEAWTAYYSSRLSVVLPGFLARLALPALPANLLLHLALYACAVGAFGALVAALVLGAQPFFLRAIGSNYTDGFGITYCLLAMAALASAAARPQARLHLAAAGACAVALVSANLFYGVYLPFLAAQFLVLNRAGARQRPAWAAAWVAAGGAAAFLGFDAAGWLWGHGSKLFLAPAVRWLVAFAGAGSRWRMPAEQWLPVATWLVFPATLLAASLAAACTAGLAAWRNAGGAAAARAAGGVGSGQLAGDGRRLRRWAAWLAGPEGFAHLQYLAFCALMAAIQLQSHGVTLEFPYYADLLLPPACLALAVLLAPLVDGLSARAFGGLAAGSAALLAVAGVAALPGPVLVGFAVAAARCGSPLALPLALGALAAAALTAWRRGAGPAVAAAVVALAASSLAAGAPGWANGTVARTGYGDTVGFFAQVDDTLTLLSRRDPTLRLRLWYDQADPAAGPLYDTVACSWRLCSRLVTTSFPNVARGRMCDSQPLRPGMQLAVLSQLPPPAAAAAAIRGLAAVGLAARDLAPAAVPGPVRFTLLFLETAPLAAPAPQVLPPSSTAGSPKSDPG